MIVIKTALNYGDVISPDDHFEVITNHVSETVPEQGLSIRQLVDNYTRTGAIPQSGRKGHFFDDENDDFPDNFNSLDLVEKDEYLMRRRQALEEKEQAIKSTYAADDKRSEKEATKQIASAAPTPEEGKSTNLP